MEVILKKWENKPYISIESTLPDLVFKILDKATSYKIKDFEFIDNAIYTCQKCGWWKLVIHATSDYCKRCGTQCNTGLWDGQIRLMSKTRQGKYYFPVGLLNSVESTLASAGFETRLLGWPLEPQGEARNLELTWNGWEPRKHQNEAIVASLARLHEGRGAVLEMSTGGGKTNVALKLIQELKVNTLILVHKKNLMEQWNKEIKKTLNWTPELFGDSKKEIGPITIGMTQSVTKANDFPLEMFDFICVDEAHHCPCDQTYNILMKSNAYYKYGMTATPYRTDGNEMKLLAAIGAIIKVSSIQDLIKKGILAKPTIEFINAPPGRSGETYAEAYKNQITLNQQRNELIAQKAYELQKKNLNILITVEQIRHGKTLESMIQGSKFVHGTTKKEEAKKAMEDFENGKLKILISTLLGEGWNCQGLNAIILASGGKSEVSLIQKVGRVLRITNNKKEALIIDIQDSGKWMRDHSQLRAKKLMETYATV